MSIATLGVVAAQLLSIVLDWNCLPAGARFSGFLVGLLGDLFFLLAVVCMRDSWRAGIPDKDKTALVTTGIYKVSRNPAFLGFDLQYLGVLLLYCNPLTAVFSLFAIVMLHLQILQEERYLTEAFGAPYRAYCSRVFRYISADGNEPAKRTTDGPHGAARFSCDPQGARGINVPPQNKPPRKSFFVSFL